MFSNLASAINQINKAVESHLKDVVAQHLRDDFASGNDSKNSNRASLLVANVSNRASLLDTNVRDYFVNLLSKYAFYSPKRNAWRKGTLEKITEEMKEKFPGLNLSPKQLKKLEKNLDKIYQYEKHTESKPDFFLNDHNKMLKGSDDASQKLLPRDLKAKKFHKKILPCSSRLNTLYEGCHNEEAEVVQSKHVIHASSHHAVGSGSMCIQSCVNEEVDESLRTNSRLGNNIKPNQDRGLEWQELDNSGSLLNFPISPNEAQRSELQELDTRSSPKRPKTNDSRMTEQNEQPLFSSPPSPQNCGFESEPTIKSTSFGKNNYSINRCITEYYELQGFEQSDLPHVVEIFRDNQNREAFLTLQKCERGLWLRANIASKSKISP